MEYSWDILCNGGKAIVPLSPCQRDYPLLGLFFYITSTLFQYIHVVNHGPHRKHDLFTIDVKSKNKIFRAKVTFAQTLGGWYKYLDLYGESGTVNKRINFKNNSVKHPSLRQRSLLCLSRVCGKWVKEDYHNERFYCHVKVLVL